MASHPETDSGAFLKVAVLLLGFLVAVVGVFALMLWAMRARRATMQAPRRRRPRRSRPTTTRPCP